MARRDEQDDRNRRYGQVDPNREREGRTGEPWGRGREDEERYGRGDTDWRNRQQQQHGGEHEYERGFGSQSYGGESGREGQYGRGREWDREHERSGGMTGRGRGNDEYERGGGFQRSYGEPGQMRYGREYDESDRFGRDWRGQDPNQWNQYGREGQFGQGQYGGQHQGGWGQQGRGGQWGGMGQQGQGQWGQGQWGDERSRGGQRDYGSEHRGQMGGRNRDWEHEDEQWGRGQHRNDDEQRRHWREQGQR